MLFLKNTVNDFIAKNIAKVFFNFQKQKGTKGNVEEDVSVRFYFLFLTLLLGFIGAYVSGAPEKQPKSFTVMQNDFLTFRFWEADLRSDVVAVEAAGGALLTVFGLETGCVLLWKRLKGIKGSVGSMWLFDEE